MYQRHINVPGGSLRIPSNSGTRVILGVPGKPGNSTSYNYLILLYY